MKEITIYPSSKQNNEVLANKLCVGIDLGTTTTITCVVDAKDVNLKNSLTIPVKHIDVVQKSPLEYDSDITDTKVASIVAFYEDRPFVGSNLYHLKGKPGFEYKKNIFYHWKLELGIDQNPMYPNAITPKIDMPYKVAGGILNYIRKAGLKKEELKNTIITVPASFQANQRNDVLKAAKMAKIQTNEQMLIDEPNAAFLGYFNSLSNDKKSEWSHKVRNRNILIVDFGGGTLDLSLLNVDFKYETGITISNIAISRYNDLGGQDIDMIIAEEFLYPKLTEKNEDLKAISLSELNNIILPQLATIAEKLKIGISQKINLRIADKLASEVNIDNITFTERNISIEFNNEILEIDDITISATEFKDLFRKIFTGNEYNFEYQDKTVTSISKSINMILEKAEIGLNEVHSVLLAGGSSLNPFLASMIKEKLHSVEILTNNEPDKLIAEGAAVYAYFFYVHGISLITPITSETIGITLARNQFFPIIEKGKALPQKISFPNFKLQTNLNNQIVVPICINGNDFPIGEIRSDLNKIYDLDSIVKIEAELTLDKVFKMKVYIEDEYIGEANFDNPYVLGKTSKENKELYETKSKLNTAIQKGNYSEEKQYSRSIIWKYNDVDNYKGCLEAAETYSKRFDDQDESVWNMQYIANNRLGRKGTAKKCIEKALELNPMAGFLIYNYSVLLEETESVELALKYLEDNKGKVSHYKEIYYRIIILKDRLGYNVENDAEKVTEEYKAKPHSFSDFARRNILPAIFRIANEPYSFVDPTIVRNRQDEKNYLKFSDTPIDINDLPF